MVKLQISAEEEKKIRVLRIKSIKVFRKGEIKVDDTGDVSKTRSYQEYKPCNLTKYIVYIQ